MKIIDNVREIHTSRQRIKKESQRLNQLLHNLNITAPQRVLYVSGMLLSMQSIDDNGSIIKGLEPSDLKGKSSIYKPDGEIIVDRIRYYLVYKGVEEQKRKLMMSSFLEISKDEHRDRKSTLSPEVSGLLDEDSSANKQIFTFIFEKIYKVIQEMNKHVDVMGEMYSEFLKYALGDGKEIGIILTPPQITQLMSKLLGINSDSKVLDLSTGSAGFLISAMEMMCEEARCRYESNDVELQRKINNIKSHQLLGVELNAEMYTLAATNMILRGDGSSTIIKEDAFRLSTDIFRNFKADRLLLNPPFSYHEKGMPFVKLGLDNLVKRGLAAVIIQDSAGAGQSSQTNKEILKKHTLLASIKMPKDLFLPMAGVQTSIYIFKAGEPHNFNNKVRFIDFRDDGYRRTNRAVKEVNNPELQYSSLIDIYHGRADYRLYGDKYIEDTISDSGDDWNFEQHYHVKEEISTDDFTTVLEEHIIWESQHKLKQELLKHKENVEKTLLHYKRDFLSNGGRFIEYRIGELFDKVENIRKPKYSVRELRTLNFDNNTEWLPVLTATSEQHGLAYKVPRDDVSILKNVISVSANGTNTGTMFYQSHDFAILQDSYAIKFKDRDLSENQYLYLLTALQKSVKNKYDWAHKATWEKIKNDIVSIPVTKGGIAYDYIDEYIKILKPQKFNN